MITKVQLVKPYTYTQSFETPRSVSKQTVFDDKVSFKGLMSNKDKESLKMCVYDLDDTLLEGSQESRNKVLDFSKNNKTLVYSSARPLKNVLPLIKDGTLVMPDFYVGNNGINIYKNVNGKLEEISDWSDRLAAKFNKDKVRSTMLDLAKANMFDKYEWEKITKTTTMPEGQQEFRGSKITEYEVFGSPLNIYFMMAPGIFEKTRPLIEEKLKENNIEADIIFQNFDKNNLKNLGKYFPPQVAQDMLNHALPRLNKDGSVDVTIITAKTDKGEATEYIRNELGIEKNEIFAAGDGENDYSHTNKGYLFGLVSNATKGLKDLIKKLPNPNIIQTSKPGVEGVWEIVEP
ncbi:MAG: HAD-IIB family hydrolase [Candidatus Gastranaerophilaceae bacterium]|jgi:HAD superfamily hydrolase (TIGR01484 family)